MWLQGAETTAGAMHYAETRRDSDGGLWKVSGRKEVSGRDGPAKMKLQGVNDLRLKHLLSQADVDNSEGAPMPFVVYVTDLLSERKRSEATMTRLQFDSVTTSQIT